MSLVLNRTTSYPVMPEFAISSRLGAMLFQSRAQTEQTLALGEAFFSVFRSMRNGLRRFDASVTEARAMRDLVGLSDQILADIGIKRSQIPDIIAKGGLDKGVETAVGRYLGSMSGRAAG